MRTILFTAAVSVALFLSGCVNTPPPAPPAPRTLDKPAPITMPAPRPAAKGLIPSSAPAIKVALLVPLSGESATIGNAMLDAANMALYDSYLTMPSERIRSQIVLLPKDTGNTPAEAARMAQQAVDQGASFIIGPLFSQSVSAIAPILKDKNIPMLSFSNNKAVATNSIFTYGFLPEQQVARMAEYTYLHGLQRVAVLAPNDSYGQKVKDTLTEAYSKKGGIVTPTEFYAPSPANIDAAVSRIAASYSNVGEDRRFQAIFIADGGAQLKNILASLKKYQIDPKKVKLLGTGLWDDPAIARMPEMTGAWFPSAPPEAYRNFEKRFMVTYGYKPMRLASLAYDAVTLATTLSMPVPTGGINTVSLTDPKGFNGPSNGLYRLLPNGTSDRRLAVMEITPEGAKVIDPALRSF